ncbi:hypothetical protein B1992_13135 [Pseudoxanthomonas broegbernensis]|uniref:SURF1-like protein n=1 Tax=Pseudoxanthomonas broegbernensis TaxID=83619 RepID=A0A7V8GKM4_9GAMM|nr:SURF1 family protein [Pseudoxanthomonas broegbernensis]KAF1685199.1 hypothetical protein B1992_13135 [Pseudoxanthomonas broegbernensis]
MPLPVGWALALAVAVLFAGLGGWQLQRMQAKQALLDASAQVLRQRQAVPLARAADPARARDYDWAAGAGRFAALPAVLLDNQSRDGHPGVRAYRVFLPEADGGDAAPALLVELGWLPLPGDRRLPTVALPDAGRVEGLLLPPPSPGLLRSVEAQRGAGTLLAMDLEPAAVAAALGLPALAPRILRLDPALPLGYARDLELLPNTLPPQRHLGYAVQWFALAAAVLVVALVLTLRGRRRPRA